MYVREGGGGERLSYCAWGRKRISVGGDECVIIYVCNELTNKKFMKIYTR